MRYPIPEGQSHEPYVLSPEKPQEFTLKAVIPGILFGIFFGAAIAYLGLQAGLTISTSIPIAAMTVSAFRMMRGVGIRGVDRRMTTGTSGAGKVSSLGRVSWAERVCAGW